MSSFSVSALIITYNEEKKIASCLKHLTWTDEIIVVDAMSTDKTKSIVCDPSQPWAGKLHFFERKWTGFKDQRNFCLSQAHNNWVLVVDADEECTPELEKKIRDLLNQKEGPDLSAYKIHRKEFFLSKPILYGMWNPSYQDRFFNRIGVQYINDVHEYPKFEKPPGHIHEPLLHKSDMTVETYIAKLNRYTTIEAQDRYNQGQRTNAFKLIMAFPAHAFKSYFYYQAYRDGIHGLIISLLEGMSRVARQIKIWQIMQMSKNRT